MDKNCHFCTPSNSSIFYEDLLVIGLWDGFPVTDGHALIIPRRHIASWFDATDEEQLALMAAIKITKDEICRHYKPDGFNIGINLGEAAGQTVFHLHVHVIPRYHGDVPDPRGGVRYVIPSKANYLASKPETPAFLSSSPHNRSLIRGDDDPLLPHLLADLDRAIGADLTIAFLLKSGLKLVIEHLKDLLGRGDESGL